MEGATRVSGGGVTADRPVSRLAAVTLGGLAFAIMAAVVPLSVLAHQNPLASAGTGLALGVPFAAVGVVVLRRQGNLIGWLSLAFAIVFLLSTDAGFYLVARYRLGQHLPLAPVMLFLQPLWVVALAILPLIVLLFPEGRLPSSRWWPVLALYAALSALFLVTQYTQAAAALTGHDIRVDASGDLTGAAHSAGWTAGVGGAGFLLLVLLALSFAGRQLLSWRRSAGERRQQLTWLVSGGAFSVLSVAVSAAAGSAGGIGQAVSSILGFGLVAIPLAIGVGILKYRLYDIDRIISRTLAYAIVTGLLAGVYAGLVLLAESVLPRSSSAGVAVATLIAAALFSPLRRRVQRVVDHQFNRARYDADQTVAAYAARLKDTVDLESVREDLTRVIQQALEPSYLSLWTDEDGQGAV
jgi:hypothetical protein